MLARKIARGMPDRRFSLPSSELSHAVSLTFLWPIQLPAHLICREKSPIGRKIESFKLQDFRGAQSTWAVGRIAIRSSLFVGTECPRRNCTARGWRNWPVNTGRRKSGCRHRRQRRIRCRNGSLCPPRRSSFQFLRSVHSSPICSARFARLKFRPRQRAGHSLSRPCRRSPD